MRQLPGRKGVGGEPLVDHAQRADHFRVREFPVELRDLRSQQQPFVHDGSRRQRRNVEYVLVLDIGLRDFPFRALAHHVKLAVQLILRQLLLATHEDLLDVGLRSARHSPDSFGVHWRVPPAEHFESLFVGNALQHAFYQQTRLALDWKKDHADAVLAWFRQTKFQLSGFAHEERMGDLDGDARAIAGFRIAAAGAAMREVYKNLDALDDDVV